MKDLSYYSDYYIDLSVDLPPLNLKNIFGSDNETSLEIGFGEGDFLIELAKYNKDKNFLGLEVKKNRFKKAISHAYELGLQNIKFIHLDASINLLQVFQKNSFSNVYINFPDPWPKTRHQKHRILQTDLLEQLYQITNNKSYIEIASDHKEYIDLIFNEIRDLNLYSLKSRLKYFGSYMKPNKNITKFERQFINERREIYYLSYIKGKRN